MIEYFLWFNDSFFAINIINNGERMIHTPSHVYIQYVLLYFRCPFQVEDEYHM